MFEVFTSIFYFPGILFNMIGLLLSFVFMLNLKSLSIIATAENIVFNRYSAITRRIHLPKHRTPRQFTPSISFMGGGQLWMFAIGVGHYVYENYDINCIKFLASSSGTFAAVPLACGLDPYDWCKRDWAKCIAHFEARGVLGCLYDTKHFYYGLWNEYLPEDAHVRCSGRLFISVTLFPSMKNKVISQFHTRDELIWAIVGSICLPFVFIRDFPVKCSDEIGYVLDGGFSNDSPCLDSYTITVSALHRKADIKPVMSISNPDSSSSHNGYSSPGGAEGYRGPRTRSGSGGGSGGGSNGGAKGKGKDNERTGALSLSGAEAGRGGAQAQAGLAAWVARSGWQVTPADYDNPMTGTEEARPAVTDYGEEDGSSSDSESDFSEGNLLVETAAEDAEAESTRIDCFSPIADADPSNGNDKQAAAMAAAYRESIRIRPIDIIRVPLYDRVWQIGSIGQDSASKCLDFERHEWVSIRKVHLQQPPAPATDAHIQ